MPCLHCVGWPPALDAHVVNSAPWGLGGRGWVDCELWVKALQALEGRIEYVFRIGHVLLSHTVKTGF